RQRAPDGRRRPMTPVDDRVASMALRHSEETIAQTWRAPTYSQGTRASTKWARAASRVLPALPPISRGVARLLHYRGPGVEDLPSPRLFARLDPDNQPAENSRAWIIGNLCLLAGAV